MTSLKMATEISLNLVALWGDNNSFSRDQDVWEADVFKHTVFELQYFGHESMETLAVGIR